MEGMEKQLTAVEHLGIAFRQWQKDWDYFEKTGKNKPASYDEFIQLFLKIENQQIANAFMNGGNWEELPQPRFENYYTQTFKSE
jgi:hypothetical protein